jgi:flavin reductase (DIM6/NTAB) family NADH-FMN oxidoreductase RutF
MKRPWNIVDPPIYSLITYDKTGKLNMNICSYVSAVSIKPKLFIIAIDYNSKTYENLKDNSTVVLQLLNKSHLKIIRKLGKSTGKHIDKEKYLRSKKLLNEWRDKTVLKNVCALIELSKTNEINISGDHAIFSFSVTKFKTYTEDQVLSFKDLIEHKIIL